MLVSLDYETFIYRGIVPSVAGVELVGLIDGLTFYTPAEGVLLAVRYVQDVGVVVGVVGLLGDFSVTVI